jgi:hypothetical protein
MTEKGFEEIRSIRHQISPNPPAIIIGTGKRHSDVFAALDLRSGKKRYTSVVGDADSLEMVGEEKMVILADGTLVPFDQHTSIADTEEAAKKLAACLESGTVVCSGRPFMIALGVNGKSAAIYRIFIVDGKIGGIDELTAEGVVDPVLQK